MKGRRNSDMSFSGLKAAVARHLEAEDKRTEGKYTLQNLSRVAEAFQEAAFDQIVDKTSK